ncbi:AAA family ATPase [Myxococcota bacterium]|nr:AAA family ATPase [Myxococcota bacterium]
MIRSFTAKAFKSLLDVRVDLASVNVFVGANGSGKSNLLEAIGLLSAAASGRVDDGRLMERGVRPGLPRLYKTSFRNTRSSAEIRFGAQGDGASYEVGLFAPMDDAAPVWRYHTELLREGRTRIVGRSHHSRERYNPEAGLAALKRVDLRPETPAERLLRGLEEYGIYSPATDFLRGVIPDPSQRNPVGLRGGRLPEALAGLISSLRARRDLFDRTGSDDVFDRVQDEILEMIDWAETYRAVPLDRAPQASSVPSARTVLLFRDRHMAPNRNTLTGYDASEGALFVLFNAVLALHPKAPRFLAVDNADHGLNPRLARRLMSCLCRWVLELAPERQILLTTHNPLVLDGLPIQDPRVRLFTVSRSAKGRTVVAPVVLDDRLRKMAAQGWTLSRLWVMGHLGGGVPDV